MIELLDKIDLKAWVEAQRDDAFWQTSRVRVLWDKDYLAMVSRGPTRNLEFHVNPWSEIFSQVEGQLNFTYVEADGRREVRVLQPGQWLLLPANVPHAPRRPNDASWTLVVERTRALPREGTDRYMWFCEHCNHKLHEIAATTYGGPGRPNPALQEANEVLRAHDRLRTCPECGEVQPPPA